MCIAVCLNCSHVFNYTWDSYVRSGNGFAPITRTVVQYKVDKNKISHYLGQEEKVCCPKCGNDLSIEAKIRVNTIWENYKSREVLEVYVPSIDPGFVNEYRWNEAFKRTMFNIMKENNLPTTGKGAIINAKKNAKVAEWEKVKDKLQLAFNRLVKDVFNQLEVSEKTSWMVNHPNEVYISKGLKKLSQRVKGIVIIRDYMHSPSKETDWNEWEYINVLKPRITKAVKEGKINHYASSLDFCKWFKENNLKKKYMKKAYKLIKDRNEYATFWMHSKATQDEMDACVYLGKQTSRYRVLESCYPTRRMCLEIEDPTEDISEKYADYQTFGNVDNIPEDFKDRKPNEKPQPYRIGAASLYHGRWHY